MKLLTFTDLGLEPGKNMIPRGAADLGAPHPDCKLRYDGCSEKKKLTFILELINRFRGNGSIAPPGFPLAVILIDSGGIAHAALLTAVRDAGKDWEHISTSSPVTEDSSQIRNLVKVFKPGGIAVFEELEPDVVTPVRRTPMEELAGWQEKEFEL